MSLAAAKPFASVAYPLDEASGNGIDAVGAVDLTDNNTVGADASGPFGACRRFNFDDSESLGGLEDHLLYGACAEDNESADDSP